MICFKKIEFLIQIVNNDRSFQFDVTGKNHVYRHCLATWNNEYDCTNHSQRKKTLVRKRTIDLFIPDIDLEKLVSRLLSVHRKYKMASSSSENKQEFDLDTVLDLLDSGFFDGDAEIKEEINSMESEVNVLFLELLYSK